MFFLIEKLVIVMRMWNGNLDRRCRDFFHTNPPQQQLPLFQMPGGVNEIVPIIDKHRAVGDGTNPEIVTSVSLEEVSKLAEENSDLLK